MVLHMGMGLLRYRAGKYGHTLFVSWNIFNYIDTYKRLFPRASAEKSGGLYLAQPRLKYLTSIKHNSMDPVIPGP